MAWICTGTSDLDRRRGDSDGRGASRRLGLARVIALGARESEHGQAEEKRDEQAPAHEPASSVAVRVCGRNAPASRRRKAPCWATKAGSVGLSPVSRRVNCGKAAGNVVRATMASRTWQG